MSGLWSEWEKLSHKNATHPSCTRHFMNFRMWACRRGTSQSSLLFTFKRIRSFNSKWKNMNNNEFALLSQRTMQCFANSKQHFVRLTEFAQQHNCFLIAFFPPELRAHSAIRAPTHALVWNVVWTCPLLAHHQLNWIAVRIFRNRSPHLKQSNLDFVRLAGVNRKDVRCAEALLVGCRDAAQFPHRRITHSLTMGRQRRLGGIVKIKNSQHVTWLRKYQILYDD